MFERAEELQRKEIEEGIAKARQYTAKKLLPAGECYYCDTPLPDGQLFCDSTCSDDYHWEQERKRVNSL